MQDANSSLQQSIKAKDMHKADVAQAVLEDVQKKTQTCKVASTPEKGPSSSHIG